jgi:filamentous hemagglutinin
MEESDDDSEDIDINEIKIEYLARRTRFMPKGRLFGNRTEIKGSQENKRSLQRENESADRLVENGYNVEQNPLTKTTDNLREGAQPDYRINGEIFDNYAPSNKADVEQIRHQISRKVKKKQTYRVILNLDDCDVPITDIKTMLTIRKPVLNLQQLIIIKNRQLIEII